MSWLVDEVLLLLLLLLLVSCVVVALVVVWLLSLWSLLYCCCFLLFLYILLLLEVEVAAVMSVVFWQYFYCYPCSDSCCSCLPPDTNALGFIEARHFEGRPRSLVFCVQDVFNMAPDFSQNTMQVCLQSKQASVRPSSPLSIPRTGGSVQHHALTNPKPGSVNTKT